MTIKVSFQTYTVTLNSPLAPSVVRGSWADWTDFCLSFGTLSRRVESENDGEAGAIVFDDLSLTFTVSDKIKNSVGSYITNPVLTAFSGDLDTKPRYIIKIEVLSYGETVKQIYEGMVDFTSIMWPVYKEVSGEYINSISFNVVDKLSALGILTTEASEARTETTIFNEYESDPNYDRIDYYKYYNDSICRFQWANSATFDLTTTGANTPVLGELIQVNWLKAAIPSGYAYLVGTDDFVGLITWKYYGVVGGGQGDWVYYDLLSDFDSYFSWTTDLDVTGTIDANRVSPLNNCALFKKYFYNTDIYIYNTENVNKTIYKYEGPGDERHAYTIVAAPGEVIEYLDGFKIISALLKRLWPDITITFNFKAFDNSFLTEYSLPLDFIFQLLNAAPFGFEPLEALSYLMNIMQAWIYVDRSGNAVVENLKFANEKAGSYTGNFNTIVTDRFTEIVKHHFWDKLVDAVEVYIKTWMIDWVTQEAIDGSGYYSLTTHQARNLLSKNVVFSWYELDKFNNDYTTNYKIRKEPIWTGVTPNCNTRGDWSYSPTDYTYGDVVNYQGTIYLCIWPNHADAVQHNPTQWTTYWTPKIAGTIYDEDNLVRDWADILNEIAEAIAGEIFLFYGRRRNSYDISIGKVSYDMFDWDLMNKFVYNSVNHITMALEYDLDGLTLNATIIDTTANTFDTDNAIITKRSDGYITGNSLGSGGNTSLGGSSPSDNGLLWNGSAEQLNAALGRLSLDLDSYYLPISGSGSITTLGVVTVGTWNADVIVGQYGGTGIANTGKTITLGGSISTIGAFTLDITLTGNTALTFPTGGTLLTSIRTLTMTGTTNQVSVTNSGVAQDLSADRSWTFSLPQNIHATADVNFNSVTTVGDVTIGGNIILTGQINQYNVVELNVQDKLIRLNDGGTDTTAIGAGLIVEGTTGSNLTSLLFDGTKWTISHNLYGPDFSFVNGALSGNLTQTGNVYYKNAFTSGWAGSGFQLDYGVTIAGRSNLEIDNLTVRKTMSIYELLIRQINAVNGNLFVSSNAKCVSADATSITFEDPTGHNVLPFSNGDLLIAQRLKLNGDLGTKLVYAEFSISPTSGISGMTVNGTWNTAPGSYADVVGVPFVRVGSSIDSTRRGSIYLASDDSNSPFIDIIDGVDSWTAWGLSTKTKARLGKLTGINTTYFPSLSGYGLYSENAYLSGTIVGSTITTSIGTGKRVVIDTTDGGQLRFYNDSNVNTIKIGLQTIWNGVENAIISTINLNGDSTLWSSTTSTIAGISWVNTLNNASIISRGASIIAVNNSLTGSATGILGSAQLPTLGTGTAYGGLFSANTGSAGIHYGIYAQASGGAANYGGYFTAVVAANSYAGYFNGNVHITDDLDVVGDTTVANITVTGTFTTGGTSTDLSGTTLNTFTIDSDASGATNTLAFGIGGTIISDGTTISFNKNISTSGTVVWSGGGSANSNTAYSHTLLTNNPHGVTLAQVGAQAALSGTGFVKISGTTISYDNSTYLTSASSLDPSKVSQTAFYRFVTDTEKSTWNAKGSVTSVAMSVPTGLSISGSPITTSGTLALTLTAGYSIPTDINQGYWTTAYTNRIATFTTTGNNGSATFSSNTLNIPTYTLAGLGGITLTSLSGTSPITYNNTTGAIGLDQTANYSWSGTHTMGGTLKSAGAGEGANGYVLNSSGIFGYSAILGTVFSLPSDGSAPTFSSGVIKFTTYELYTSGVIRTSTTVGDGTVNSSGVLINDTGVYGMGASQTPGTGNFRLSATTGNLYAINVDLTGAITASSGSIGGFTIATNLTYGGKTAYNSEDTGIFIGVSGIGLGLASAGFYVSASGALTATGATISGAITATSGSFTGAINASSGNFTGYVTAGTLRFGKDVSGTDDGLWANAYNYWYDSGKFFVGDVTNSMDYNVTNAGVLTLKGSITSSATITGGSIIGSTFKTAVADQRMEINGGNYLAYYNSVNILMGGLTYNPNDINGLQLSSTGELSILSSANQINIGSTLNMQFNDITSGGDIYLTSSSTTRLGVGTGSPMGVVEIFTTALDAPAYLYYFGNAHGIRPTDATGLQIGYNYTNGGGEIALFSNKGTGSIGGFNFYNAVTGGAITLLGKIDANGITTSGTITSGLINGQTITSTASFTGSVYAAAAITSSSFIQATTAKLTYLTDGYIPYHVSDASGLGNSVIYTDGTFVGIGGTGVSTALDMNDGQISGVDVLYGDSGGALLLASYDKSTLTSSYIGFYTANGATSGERMRIIGTGQVGIGVTPGTTYTLEINGALKSSNITVGNSTTGAAGGTIRWNGTALEVYNGSSWGIIPTA